jgi:hypothetical protein
MGGSGCFELLPRLLSHSDVLGKAVHMFALWCHTGMISGWNLVDDSSL